MSRPTFTASKSQVMHKAQDPLDGARGSSPPSEWQLLQTILISENGRSILSELKQVAQNLRDTKSQTWQKRVNTIQHIKTIFLITLNYIEYDPDIVDEVAKGCPQITNIIDVESNRLLTAAGDKSHLSHASSKSSLKHDSRSRDQNQSRGQRSMAVSAWPNLSGQVPDQLMRKSIQYHIISWMQRILQPLLILQLSDTKTAVVKETCMIILWIKKEFPDEFAREYRPEIQARRAPKRQNLGGGNGGKYLDGDALPKLICSTGNKNVQEMGHSAFQQILEGGPLIDNLIYHLIPHVNSKNSLMRLRNAQYFEVLLSNAIDQCTKDEYREHIERHSDILDYFLIRASEDQSLDVRNQALFCVMLYRQLFPQKCSDLILHGITQTIVRTQIIQQLNMQQDLDDNFARSLRDMNLKQQCNQMQRLRQLFDSAFTAEQFRSLHRQRDLGITQIDKKTPIRRKSEHMDIQARGAAGSRLSSRASPRHQNSPNTNLVKQKQKAVHLDKVKVYQLQRSGTLQAPHCGSKSVASLGGLSGNEKLGTNQRQSSKNSRMSNSKFVTPRRNKNNSNAKQDEDEQHHHNSTPNLLRLKTMAPGLQSSSQLPNLNITTQMVQKQLGTPVKKTAVQDSDDKAASSRRVQAIGQGTSKLQSKSSMAQAHSSRFFNKPGSTSAAPQHNSLYQKTKAEPRTPRKGSTNSSVSKTSQKQTAKPRTAICPREAKYNPNRDSLNKNQQPQRGNPSNAVNAQRVDSIRMKYTLHEKQHGCSKLNQSMNNFSRPKLGESKLYDSKMAQSSQSKMSGKSNEKNIKMNQTGNLMNRTSSNLQNSTSKNSGAPLRTVQSTMQQPMGRNNNIRKNACAAGMSNDSPRSQESSRLFEFSSQNIGQQKSRNNQVGYLQPKPGLAKSLNNLNQSMRNEKAANLTQRVHNQKDFSSDYNKLNSVDTSIATSTAQTRATTKPTIPSSKCLSVRTPDGRPVPPSQDAKSQNKQLFKVDNNSQLSNHLKKFNEKRMKMNGRGKDEDAAARGGNNSKKKSGRMTKQVDKQSVNSRNAGATTGTQIDHGSTEVTTIESYELTSAFDPNIVNSGLSREISCSQADSSRATGADGQRKYQGAYPNGQKRGAIGATGDGENTKHSEVFPSGNQDYKDSQMFEVVQFFNIKDITQLATKTEADSQSKIAMSHNNDSFESSDVSYARDTEDEDSNELRQQDDGDIIKSMANMCMTNVPQQVVPNPPEIFPQSCDESSIMSQFKYTCNVQNVDDTQQQSSSLYPSIEYESTQEYNGQSNMQRERPEALDLNEQTMILLEECVQQAKVEQIQTTLGSLKLPEVTERSQDELLLTTSKLTEIFRSNDGQYITMYEMKEAFERHGQCTKILSANSELMVAMDYHLPDQVGYGVFQTEQVLCVSLLWAAGISHGSTQTTSSGCSDISDEISPSNLKAPYSIGQRYGGDQHLHQKMPQHEIINEEAEGEEGPMDEQAVFWDILNEHE